MVQSAFTPEQKLCKNCKAGYLLRQGFDSTATPPPPPLPPAPASYKFSDYSCMQTVDPTCTVGGNVHVVQQAGVAVNSRRMNNIRASIACCHRLKEHTDCLSSNWDVVKHAPTPPAPPSHPRPRLIPLVPPRTKQCSGTLMAGFTVTEQQLD